jgi:uncharacterized Ntn-hydrolase superfamily protein
MTFAIAAFCRKTGHIGVCQTTSTPAVGARCVRVLPGRGVVVVQAAINYRIVEAAAQRLQAGDDADAVLTHLEQTDAGIDYRQVAIIRRGETAMRAGKGARDWAGGIQGPDFVVLGNVVARQEVVDAMAHSFRSSGAETLEERLLRAIEAGDAAGGERRGQNSIVLCVAGDEPVPLVDLRVDMHPQPVAEMRRIFDWYKPLIPYYVRRNADPTVPLWRDYLREIGWPDSPSAPPIGTAAPG